MFLLDVSPVPTEVKVTNVTSTNATLSWLPGNSDYEHVVSINGVEKMTVSPGCASVSLFGRN